MFLPELIDSQPIGQAIINMQWSVMDLSPAGYTLLTSDRRCLTSTGFGHPSCLLSLPMSPTRLFVAANVTRQLEKLAAQQPLRDTIRNANHLVVRNAVQNVYGSTNSHLVFVEKRVTGVTGTPYQIFNCGPQSDGQLISRPRNPHSPGGQRRLSPRTQ